MSTPSTPSTFHSLSTWRRLGSEDAADDAVRGHIDALDRETLLSALAEHHEADLAACMDDDAREEALGALAAGYLQGG